MSVERQFRAVQAAQKQTAQAAEQARKYGLSECAPQAEVNKSVRARNVLVMAGVKVGTFKRKADGFEVRATAGQHYRGFPRATVAAATGLPATATDRELDIAVRTACESRTVVRAAAAVPAATPPAPVDLGGDTVVGSGGVGQHISAAPPRAAGDDGFSLIGHSQRVALVDRGLLPESERLSRSAGMPVEVRPAGGES